MAVYTLQLISNTKIAEAKLSGPAQFLAKQWAWCLDCLVTSVCLFSLLGYGIDSKMPSQIMQNPCAELVIKEINKKNVILFLFFSQ